MWSNLFPYFASATCTPARAWILKTANLLTFSVISALGGCESQVRSHMQANVNVGNSKENLIDALAQSLPDMGFLRTLNTLARVNAVIPEPGRAQ